MDKLSTAAQARYQALVERYLASLPAKRQRLMTLYRQWAAGGWQDDALGPLKLEVHRLAGSAGSYGLEGLGQRAARLDRDLGRAAQDAAMREACEAQMQALLSALDQLIDPSR